MYYFTNVTVTSCSKQCYLNFKLNLIVSTGLKQAFEASTFLTSRFSTA